MAAAAQRCVLCCGARSAELEAPLSARRGGLRALEREAERAFGMPPQAFELFAKGVRLESPEALQRALQAGDGTCRVEVRERPEWQAVSAAASALEGRLMAKVDAALAGLRSGLAAAEQRLDQGLAPLVQSLALEQIDLRSSVGALQGLAPLVQSMAMEQLEAREAAAARPEATREAAAAPAAAPQLVFLCAPPGGAGAAEEEEHPQASAALKDLEELERQLRQDFGGRLGAVEQADEFLFSELQAVCAQAKGMEKDVKKLQAGLQDLEQKQSEQGEDPKDYARLQAGPKGAAGGPDAWLSWNDGGLPAALPYSGKVIVDFPQKGAVLGKRGGPTSKRTGVDLAPQEGLASFARVSSLRPLERTSGCRSSPLLPPLH